MSTPQTSAPSIDSSAMHLAFAQDDGIRPLPTFVTLPLIALTSAGLWLLIYKTASGIFSMLH